MAGDVIWRECCMNTKMFFNTILVLSFVLTNLTGGVSYQQIDAPQTSSSGIHLILEKIKSWVQGQTTVDFKPKEIFSKGKISTQTPTPDIGIAPILEPTLTYEPTLLPTETPITTPTPKPTETIAPTITTTSQPTETISPTITATSQPTETYKPSDSIGLNLIGEPSLVSPGYPVLIEWQIKGWNQDNGSAKISLILPDGFIPKPSDDYYLWDETEQTINITVINEIGQLMIEVAEDARGPYIIQAELIINGQIKSKAILTLNEEGLNLIGRDGGIASGIGGRVNVTFPANSIPGVTNENPLVVRVRMPSSKAIAPYYLSNAPF